MLQSDRNQFASYPESAGPEQSFSIPELIGTAFGFIQRRWLVIALAFLAVTALGEPIVFKLVTAMYNATATVYIDNRKVVIVKDQPVQDRMIDGYVLESQVEILKSENVGLEVVRKLRLADDPEFGSPKPGLVRTMLREAPPISSDFDRERRALGVLEANMTAKRLGTTYMIDISYKSVHADKAAEVANAIADAYINDQLTGKLVTSQRTIDLLNDQLKALGDQLTVAQKNVNEFRAQSKIVEGGDGRSADEQQIAQLSTDKTTARQHGAEIQARLQSLEEILNSADDMVVVTAIPEALKTELFAKQREDYLKTETRYRQLLAKGVSPDHIQLENVRKELAALRAGLREELKRVAEGYRSEFETTKRIEENLQQEIERAQSKLVATNEARVKLRQLEGVAKSLQGQYDDLQQKRNGMIQQLSMQESSQITEARIITNATTPGSKDYRKFMVGAAAVPAAGLTLGLALAFFLELLDDAFYTERQAQKVLGTKCLAIVPMWKEAAELSRRAGAGADTIAPRTIRRDDAALWSVSYSPFSYFAESVRLIKAAADMFGGGNPVKVIGLTSAVPNEGKSTIAASLAQAIAQSGSRVMLLDCDLRNPSLSAAMAPAAELGLVEVVSGEAAVNEVIWTEPATGMAFLPMVMKLRMAHTNEILASDRMKKLFDALRLMYDYVVVDLSPLAPVVDVRATANLIDSYVFVIEWGRTHTSIVRQTLEAAPTVADSLLGVVLNKTDLKRLRRYDVQRSKDHDKGYYRY